MARPKKPAPKKGKPGRKPKLEIAAVAAALASLKGNITDVAKRFGVARSSIHEFIVKNPPLQQVLHDARESMDDKVENRFFADCLKDSPQYQTSRIFYLKTRCKSRGYVEKQQFEVGDMAPTEVQEEVIASRETVTA